jgi:hypothetical protein
LIWRTVLEGVVQKGDNGGGVGGKAISMEPYTTDGFP